MRVVLFVFLAGLAVCAYRVYRQYRQEQLDQAMIQAIIDGRDPRALALLGQGADVNAVQRPARRIRSWRDLLDLLRGRPGPAAGPSALALAVQSGREGPALWLLKHGASDVHAGAPDRSLLVWAIQKRQPAVAMSLLAHGAIEVNEPDESEDTTHSLLYRATELPDETLALALIARGAHSVTGEIGEDDPMVNAAQYDMVRVLDALHRQGQSFDGGPDGPQLQPLAAACLHGRSDVVRYLVEHGARVDTDSEFSAFETPLMNAASSGRLDLVRYLLDHGARIDHEAHWGTAIVHAAANNHWDAVRILAERGAKVDASDYHGTTPLDLACTFGNAEMVHFLLQHGARPDVREHMDWSPIFSACSQGSVQIIRMLVDRGVPVNMVGDRDTRTPLMKAAEEGHVAAVRFLLSRGAEPNIKLRADPSDGIPYSSALMLARKNKHADVVKELLTAGEKW